MPVETMPIFPSWDFDATASFYGALGFREDQRFPDSYLILSHPVGIEIHFLHCTPFPAVDNDHGAYVRFASAAESDELHRAWSNADIGHGELTAPANMPYGLREFALVDPMHNRIRVGGFITNT